MLDGERNHSYVPGGILCADSSVFSLSAIVVTTVGLAGRVWSAIRERSSKHHSVQGGQFDAVVRCRVLTEILGTSSKHVATKNMNRHLQTVHRR